MSNDRPINKLSEDKFGLEESAQRFSEEYITSEFNGSVLLSGKWGSGKSSYLNLVKGASSKHITSKFNDWELLNGKWGDGKNRFLNLVQEKSKKVVVWLKQINFVDINFWESGWESKPYEIIFKGISRRCWFIARTLPLSLVPLLALCLALLDLFKAGGETVKQLDVNTWIGISVFAAVINFTLEKFSFEPLFEFLTNLHLKWTSCRKKIVFICDDFDRVEEHVRKVVYPILTKITNYSKVTLVIVGEYEKIAKNTEESLLIQKIIGHVELAPIEINSGKVWDYLEASMENKIIDIEKITHYDKKLITSIKELFIYEKRTMREAKLLLNLMERRYFKKFQDKVNLGEQFSMCYLYSFHHEVYQWLTENQSVIYQSYREVYPTVHSDEQKKLKTILLEEVKNGVSVKLAETVYYLFMVNDYQTNYPTLTNQEDFQIYRVENFETYFMFSKKNLDDIIFTSGDQYGEVKELLKSGRLPVFSRQLEKHYLARDSELESRYYYQLLRTICVLKFDSDCQEVAGQLTLSSVDQIRYKVSNYLKIVIGMTPETIYSESILNDDKLDVTQKLYLIRDFLPSTSREEMDSQFEIVRTVFEFPYEDDICSFKKPLFYLSFYKTYRNELNKSSNRYEKIINQVLTLKADKFYQFLVDDLSSLASISSTETYKVLRLEALSYSKEFKKQLVTKINSLDQEKKAEIHKMIREGK